MPLQREIRRARLNRLTFLTLVAASSVAVAAAQTSRLRVSTPGTAVIGAEPAPIAYELADAADAITIEVLDATGKVIRRVATPPAGSGVAVAAAAGEARDGNPAELPDRSKGSHRWVWDLRHQGPVPVEDERGEPQERGPVVAPGKYQVRVTALGETQTVPYTVQASHAAGTGEADLQARLALALRVRDRMSDASEAVRRIRDLRAQIAARVPGAKSPVIGLAADATARALRDIEQELVGVPPAGSVQPADVTPRVRERLSALAQRLETATSQPSAADAAAFAQLSTELDGLLEKLRGVEGNHIVAFNRLLANAELPPVEAKAAPPRL